MYSIAWHPFRKAYRHGKESSKEDDQEDSEEDDQEDREEGGAKEEGCQQDDQEACRSVKDKEGIHVSSEDVAIIERFATRKRPEACRQEADGCSEA